MIEKFFTKNSGEKIKYLHNQNEKATPLLILHGITARAEFFNDFYPYFEQDYDIYIPDFAGHGKSYCKNKGYFLEGFMQDTEEFINNVIKKPLFIIGYSMGGRVAIGLAGENPTIYKKLVIVDVAPDIDPYGLEMLIQAQKQLPEYFNNYNELEHFLRTKRGFVNEKVIKKHLAFYWEENEKGQIVTSYDREVWSVPMDKIIKDCDYLNRMIKKIEIPVLIIRGEKSFVLNRKDALKLKSNLKNAKLVEIPETTHAVITEEGEKCAEHINFFFK